VIIVTGHGSMESAIKAMKYGSYDYLQKPFKLNVLKIIIDRILEAKKLKQEKIVLKTRVKDRHRYEGLVGISLKMQEIYDTIDRMRTDAPNVLIEGESGTGKELTAHVIQRTSDRSRKPFVAMACKSLFKGVAADGQAERLHEVFKAPRKARCSWMTSANFQHPPRPRSRCAVVKPAPPQRAEGRPAPGSLRPRTGSSRRLWPRALSTTTFTPAWRKCSFRCLR